MEYLSVDSSLIPGLLLDAKKKEPTARKNGSVWDWLTDVCK